MTIEQVKDYIKKHYHDQSDAEMAEACGINRERARWHRRNMLLGRSEEEWRTMQARSQKNARKETRKEKKNTYDFSDTEVVRKIGR